MIMPNNTLNQKKKKIDLKKLILIHKDKKRDTLKQKLPCTQYIRMNIILFSENKWHDSLRKSCLHFRKHRFLGLNPNDWLRKNKFCKQAPVQMQF